MKMHPFQAEVLFLMNKLQTDTLTLGDCDRITALSIEMNKLNPKFEVIEFEHDQDDNPDAIEILKK
jgi:hypothetical protein